jgi:hypothetical protein
MDYEKIRTIKKTLKLTNEDLGNVVGKKADRLRDWLPLLSTT